MKEARLLSGSRVKIVSADDKRANGLFGTIERIVSAVSMTADVRTDDGRLWRVYLEDVRAA